MRITEFRHAPALVVGSGVAGLSAALRLGRCVLMTRGKIGGGSSAHAQGGIAAALGTDDSPALHALDTLAAAAGLGESNVAHSITHAAAGLIAWLKALGVRFDVDDNGRPALTLEAGHRTRRVAHACGDRTGMEIVRALAEAVAATPGVDVWEHYELVDLVCCERRVVGALTATPSGEFVAILAPAVLLATGGIGGLYQHTTNPADVTGDGIAIASRAGAALSDLEFVQFHPTALDVALDPSPLITEALRGEGAVIVDEHGERFIAREHPRAELAPRDFLARAIWRHRAKGHSVFLDASALAADLSHRFPGLYRRALSFGLDAREARLPIKPAAHYFMGGIATDVTGRTSVPGLWAVGEAAATGFHGANRLASNSLLEAMVMGAGAAAAIIGNGLRAGRLTSLEVPFNVVEPAAGRTDTTLDEVRRLMWDHVGLERNAAGLSFALAELERLSKRVDDLTVAGRNALSVATLVASAALRRRESRGAHWRIDYPGTNPDLAQRTLINASIGPQMRLHRRPPARLRMAENRGALL